MTAPVIAVLFGAPRWDGETGRLTRAFLSAAPENAQIVTVGAFSLAASPCDGCGACAETGECRLDDMQDVYALIERADVLVFASPVYNLSVPAPLKAIFDRMQPYWSRRFVLGMRPPVERPKKGALLTVSGSEKYAGGDVVARQTKMLMSILNCKLGAEIHVTGSDRADYAARREEECLRAADAGEKFFLGE